MIYSFHHFYYWLRGGVESGMAYRAKLFRELGLEAKFVFATTFPNGDMEHEMKSLGFYDSEVMWMYTMFSDVKIAPCTYSLSQLRATFPMQEFRIQQEADTIKYYFDSLGYYYCITLTGDKKDKVKIVELVVDGCLLRKDYYSYCKIYSEYYAPVDWHSHLYQRRYFNEDGSVAYEEIIDGDFVMYRFPDQVFYSREELVGYMMSKLNFTKDDIVIIDGEPGMIDRSAFIQNAAPARVGLMIHADHSLKSDENHIFWYYIYEYAFAHPEKIDFYITNTDAQSNLLREQLKKYKKVEANVQTIPVVGIEEIKRTNNPRKKHALLSVGRLAQEKNMNWVIEAVALAHEQIPDLTLDIYGEGTERDNLENLINKLQCQEYVHLCGFQKMQDVYQQYDAYVSASFVETLGVTLLEAVQSGLPIVGFDIWFGMQVFVDEGENGYRVPYGDVEALAKKIICLFTEADIDRFREHSYTIAKQYYEEELQSKWKKLLIPEEM